MAASYATRQIIEHVDIRDKIAREHGEKVIDLGSLPDPIQYAEVSSTKLTQMYYIHVGKTIELTTRLVLE